MVNKITTPPTQNEVIDKINELVDGKQDTLVSGTNIKTINGNSLLGSGNIDIQGGGSITIDSDLSTTSENPVQNKVITAAFGNYLTTSDASSTYARKNSDNRVVAFGIKKTADNFIIKNSADVNNASLGNTGFWLYDATNNGKNYFTATTTNLLLKNSNNTPTFQVMNATGNVFVKGDISPFNDNSSNLGSSSNRWKQLYAATSTISTSDERLKSNITKIPQNVLDAWGDVNFYQYKFNDAIESKGKDNARLHTGIIAQRIEETFKKHGLDAKEYGLLCFDSWDAQDEIIEDDTVIKQKREAGGLYSIRYEECLCMEAAYQRYRADNLENRLVKLENLLMNETTNIKE